jgi:hypothetical protein
LHPISLFKSCFLKLVYVVNISLLSLSSNRKRLFGMINELQTVFEVVSGARQQQSKERSSMDNGGRAKPVKVDDICYSFYHCFSTFNFFSSHTVTKT